MGVDLRLQVWNVLAISSPSSLLLRKSEKKCKQKKSDWMKTKWVSHCVHSTTRRLNFGTDLLLCTRAPHCEGENCRHWWIRFVPGRYSRFSDKKLWWNNSWILVYDKELFFYPSYILAGFLADSMPGIRAVSNPSNSVVSGITISVLNQESWRRLDQKIRSHIRSKKSVDIFIRTYRPRAQAN